MENREPYCLELALCDGMQINTCLKFCLFSWRDVEGEDAIVLCSECHSFLVSGKKQDMKNVWPAFMWCVLRNDMILSHSGLGVWSYVPMKWQHWWIDDFRMLHDWDERISMEAPEPVFDEIMDRQCALMQSLEELRLGDLMLHVNQFLYPTVMCPWGCSEYLHKVELLPLDVVFSRYLGPGAPVMRNDLKRTMHLKGLHNDYMDVSRCILLLMNSAWRVVPCIAFDNEQGPSVLVCQNHKGGLFLDYIHVPSHPVTTLPTRFADQLAPAVMQSRVIQPMRAKRYLMCFQMHEMRGSFGGLDTLSLGKYQRFDFWSLLTLEVGAVALRCQKDVHGLLMRLFPGGKIPAFLMADMLDTSRNLFQSDQFCPTLFAGATYMRYVDAIRLKKLRSERKETIVQKMHEGTGQVTDDCISFQPLWP